MRMRVIIGVHVGLLGAHPAIAQEAPEPGPSLNQLAKQSGYDPAQITAVGGWAFVLATGSWVLFNQKKSEGADERDCFPCGGYGLTHEFSPQFTNGPTFTFNPTTTTTTTTTTTSTSSSASSTN